MGAISGRELLDVGRVQSSVKPAAVVGMKTTIKLDLTKAVVIEPEAGGKVRLSIMVGSIPAYRQSLTLDQCGVFLFALEQAAEAAQAAA